MALICAIKVNLYLMTLLQESSPTLLYLYLNTLAKSRIKIQNDQMTTNIGKNTKNVGLNSTKKCWTTTTKNGSKGT